MRITQLAQLLAELAEQGIQRELPLDERQYLARLARELVDELRGLEVCVETARAILDGVGIAESLPARAIELELLAQQGGRGEQ